MKKFSIFFFVLSLFPLFDCRAVGTQQIAFDPDTGALKLGHAAATAITGWPSLAFGNTTSTSTATPLNLNLGGTYSSAAGANPKLVLWDNGSDQYGLGVSSSQFDFMVPTGAGFVWYINGVEKMRLSSASTSMPILTITPSPTSGILFNERDATGADWALYATTGDFYLNNGSNRFKLSAAGVITLATWQGVAIADTYISSASTWNGKVDPTRTVSTTAPLSGGGDLSANRTISIADAAADGSTKGASTYNANDFNATAGVITIDYTNGQAATGSVKGFLTAADWTTFNSKVGTARAIATTAPLSGGGDLSADRTISIANAAADGSTKGAAAFATNDFDAAAGVITIDYTNGQAATGSVKGFLTSTDWTTFNNKVATTRTVSTTAPLSGGGDLSANRTIAIAQATTSVDGYLSATDWTTFNNKVATTRTVSTTAPLSGGGDLSANRTIAIADAAADGSTKGASTYNANDFNAASGVITIDYTNGQAATGSVKGFLTAADWTTFNSKIGTITVTNNNGITQSVTGGAITLGLGNITPTSVTTGAVTGTAGTYSDVVNATDFTTGVIASYSPNVTFEGDSRTQLVANLTATKTVTTTNGSATVTTSGTFTDANVGSLITGTGIPANTYIGILNSSTSIGLSSSALTNVPVTATASGTITASITPYGYNNYMGAAAGSGTENFTIPAIGTFNGLAVAPTVGQNVGVAGKTVQNLYETMSRVSNRFRQESGMNVVVYNAGINNFVLNSETYQQAYSKIAAACQSIRRKGNLVLLVFPFTAGGSNANGTYDSQINGLNGLLRQNWAQIADGRVDWGIADGGSNQFINHTWVTVTSGSNGAALPQSTINVSTTANITMPGTITINNNAGAGQTITCTGKTSNTLTGCSGGSGTLATGGQVGDDWFSSDWLHETYAGGRKLASYVQPELNNLLTYYFQTNHGQLFVNMNKASHTNVATDGMLTLRNENPSAGQSEINFAFWNGTAFVLKENIRGEVGGVLNYGATVGHVFYAGSTGPDVYGTNGSDGPPAILGLNNTQVVAYKDIAMQAGTNLLASGNSVLKLDDNTNTVVNPVTGSGSVYLNWTRGASGLGTIFGNGSAGTVGRLSKAGGLTLNGTSDAGAGNVLLITTDEGGLSLRQSNSTAYGFDIGLDQGVDGALHIYRVAAGTPTIVLTISRDTGGVNIGGTTDPAAGNLEISGQNAKGGAVFFGNDGSRYLEWNAGLGVYNFSGAPLFVNGLGWFKGAGSPEGVITAPTGSFYSNTSGGASTTLYVKTSGAGNTGWTAK